MSVTIACDLRHQFGAVRDQKARPTCLAFAMSDVHGSLYSPYLALSVEYLYYHAVQLMVPRDPNAGVTLESACRSLRSPGQAKEADWPYQVNLPVDLSAWAPPTGCTVHRRDSTMSLDGFGQVCSHLDAGRPVVVCVELSESFYFPLADGTLPSRSPDPKTGTHAVIAVGHGSTGGEPCLLVRNSWGTSWGLGGHAFLSQSYLTNRILSTSVLSQI